MSFINFLERNLLSCPWKKYLEVDCMGCGMQRSVIYILKGDFEAAFYMYPAIYTLIFMFSYLLLHLKLNFKLGSKILLYLFILNALIIVTNFIIKSIN
ncbi:DUF2752 domain-containing protein [Urechidicola vernalis]|uniref:DUF2752 domain-containing protein n=1 Tax=Urechidicola vernalis TaxID=3075600 RepID=A0ABU2Y0U1_9FLAO|nr:DUF2752 domain-containing protein [Urechidicola sp. P050]MDT0551799.1 DUF2752 domain-containing protein [Urechidicola sp. P050]